MIHVPYYTEFGRAPTLGEAARSKAPGHLRSLEFRSTKLRAGRSRQNFAGPLTRIEFGLQRAPRPEE